MIKEYYYRTMISNFELKFKISIKFLTLTNSKASRKLILSCCFYKTEIKTRMKKTTLALVHIYM